MQSIERTPIYTIGYGSRGIDEFVTLLHQHQIAFLLDIRSRPYSRFKPEFSKGDLDQVLQQAGIRYVFMGNTLGGQPDDKTCYTNDKVDYEIYRRKATYLQGIARLRDAWAQQLRVALMCSEGKPQECHRSKLIGESLAETGVEVVHIDENGIPRPHGAVIAALTKGQLGLPDPAFRAFTSRKKYRDT